MLLLELMPKARLEFFRHKTINEEQLAIDVAHLREQITILLRDVGVSAAFDANGALQRVDVDTTDRDIHGLPNRGQLEAALPALLANNPLLSVVFIDLDEFKTVNDRIGHDRGRQVP